MSAISGLEKTHTHMQNMIGTYLLSDEEYLGKLCSPCLELQSNKPEQRPWNAMLQPRPQTTVLEGINVNVVSTRFQTMPTARGHG